METLYKLEEIASKVRDYVKNRMGGGDKVEKILPLHFRYYYLEEEYKEISKEFMRWSRVADYTVRENEYLFFYKHAKNYKERFKDFHFN